METIKTTMGMGKSSNLRLMLKDMFAQDHFKLSRIATFFAKPNERARLFNAPIYQKPHLEGPEYPVLPHGRII